MPSASFASEKHAGTRPDAGIVPLDVSRSTVRVATGGATLNDRHMDAFYTSHSASVHVGVTNLDCARLQIPASRARLRKNGASHALCTENSGSSGRRSGRVCVFRPAGFRRHSGNVHADHEATAQRRGDGVSGPEGTICVPPLPAPEPCMPAPLGRRARLPTLHAPRPLPVVSAPRLRPRESCLPQSLGRRPALPPLHADPALPLIRA